jgi:hypothetical protein
MTVMSEACRFVQRRRFGVLPVRMPSMLCMNSYSKEYVAACRKRVADFARLAEAFFAEVEAKFV